MQYINIKDTNITLSKLALGTWSFANEGVWGAQQDDLSIQTVHAALDEGITLIDTAPAYGNGHSEEVVGRALKGRRSKAIIATKSADSNPDKQTLIEACENSLKRLQTDYIDIYQIHWPRRNTPFSETMEGLTHLYKQGKIRAIGVSNFGVKDMDEMLKYGTIHTNQLAYSALFRALDHGIRQKCIQEDIGILAYSPLAQGLLTGKYENIESIPPSLSRVWYLTDDYKHLHAEVFNSIRCIKQHADELNVQMGALALAYLMHKEGVLSVLAGARNPKQLLQNAQASKVNINDEDIKIVDNCTQKLFELMGPNADMWRVESSIQ